MKNNSLNTKYVICVNNDGYEDDLKLRTVYRILPDDSAARSNYIRVIDETGEDYLYPVAYFVNIEVPHAAEQVFAIVA